MSHVSVGAEPMLLDRETPFDHGGAHSQLLTQESAGSCSLIDRHVSDSQHSNREHASDGKIETKEKMES